MVVVPAGSHAKQRGIHKPIETKFPARVLYFFCVEGMHIFGPLNVTC